MIRGALGASQQLVSSVASQNGKKCPGWSKADRHMKVRHLPCLEDAGVRVDVEKPT